MPVVELVQVLPEAVMHPVDAHLDHREELPGLRLEQVLGEPEALVGHLVDLPQQVVLVVGAEVRAVEQVLADDLLDLAGAAAAGRCSCSRVEGVRKQLTMTPFSGRGGYVPGTPSDDRPLAVAGRPGPTGAAP